MTRGMMRQLAAATVVAAGTLGVGLSAGTAGAAAHSATTFGLYNHCLINPYTCVKRTLPLGPGPQSTVGFTRASAARLAAEQKGALRFADAAKQPFPDRSTRVLPDPTCGTCRA